jgi:hypothetical protein
LCKFTACSHVGVDACFIVGNIPLVKQSFGFFADGTDAGAEYFYSGHGY